MSTSRTTPESLRPARWYSWMRIVGANSGSSSADSGLRLIGGTMGTRTMLTSRRMRSCVPSSPPPTNSAISYSSVIAADSTPRGNEQRLGSREANTRSIGRSAFSACKGSSNGPCTDSPVVQNAQQRADRLALKHAAKGRE
jgi:hypothetical protein